MRWEHFGGVFLTVRSTRYGHLFRYSMKNGGFSNSFGHLFRYFDFKALFSLIFQLIAEQLSVRFLKSTDNLTLTE